MYHISCAHSVWSRLVGNGGRLHTILKQPRANSSNELWSNLQERWSKASHSFTTCVDPLSPSPPLPPPPPVHRPLMTPVLPPAPWQCYTGYGRLSEPLQPCGCSPPAPVLPTVSCSEGQIKIVDCKRPNMGRCVRTLRYMERRAGQLDGLGTTFSRNCTNRARSSSVQDFCTKKEFDQT